MCVQVILWEGERERDRGPYHCLPIRSLVTVVGSCYESLEFVFAECAKIFGRNGRRFGTNVVKHDCPYLMTREGANN